MTTTQIAKTEFTWIPKTNEYVAEASSLPKSFCPVDGVTLLAGDGHEHPFRLDRVEAHQGETVAWVFRPANAATPAWVRVRIFND